MNAGSSVRGWRLSPKKLCLMPTIKLDRTSIDTIVRTYPRWVFVFREPRDVKEELGKAVQHRKEILRCPVPREMIRAAPLCARPSAVLRLWPVLGSLLRARA